MEYRINERRNKEYYSTEKDLELIGGINKKSHKVK